MGIIIFTLAIFTAATSEAQSGKEKTESAPAPQRASRPTLSGAAARRNENVAVNRIDNDALKEANTRLGSNYTILTQIPAELNHYAAEHGRPPGELSVLRPAEPAAGWHAEPFWNHQNSVFNARTFFQAGPVKPSRQNQYGGRFTGGLGWLGSISGAFSQRKIRGMVNGNVLVPLAGERTPTATDPRLRSLIERYLAAYPAELPNRPDFDERALNTNAPQHIDEINANLRLDRGLTSKTRLFLFHAIGRQYVDAFQLVAGQNPDMNVHNQRARATVSHALSPATDLSLGFGFTRVRSALYPEPNAVGPRVRIGYQIEELGPDSQFPINRAQNTFRFGMHGSHRAGGGRHTLTFGGDGSRFQFNGVETNNQRGVLLFISNFGRTAIENLRAGAATTYEVTIGEMARGFRSWSGSAYFADQWRASGRLQLYFGIRYSLEGAPNEVRGWNEIPYRCDCYNFSPRFHIGWQLPRGWMLRTGYSVSFGQILPVTYQQVRYNAPHAFYLQVQNPDPVDPLRGLNLSDPNLRSSPTWLSPDLVSPYSHQYGLTLERNLLGGTLRMGYFGSRSFKLLNVFIQNRAVPVPGIPLITATVNERRPNPKYYEEKNVVNAGVAYLDGGQISFDLPRWRGLSAGASYTFSKALDEGSDYVTTAANRDLSASRAQWQYESLKDRKGLSNFDSTHSLMLHQSFDLPPLAHSPAWLQFLAGGWQWSSSVLFKSGTPFTLYVGSDAPGFGNVDGGPSDRPHILDPSILGRTISHPDQAPIILRRDRFGFLTPGDLRGSLARNAFRRAAIANLNGSFSKRWRIAGASERHLQLRAESFNLGNRPQFDEPNRNLNATAFGKITNTLNDGRIFQLSLRFFL